MIEIAPSILAADFTRLGEEIAAAERGGAGIIHVDVMDGHYVPNITIGPVVVRAARRATSLPLDCHLMLSNPDKYITAFADAGASMISVHVEVATHIHRTIATIKELGLKAGVAINPGTPLLTIDEVLPWVDFVLLLTVNPGFGGQSFIETSLDRVNRMKDMIDRRRLDVRIEVDGGIGLHNISEIVQAGAEWIVMGTAVFGSGDPGNNTRALRRKALEPVSV